MTLIRYITRIQFDAGAIGLLGEEIAALGLRRPLLVTDAGIAEAGILQRVLDAARPVVPLVYDRTTENPNEASLLECLDIWRGEGCDGLIALGGGSPIDLSKAVALIASHGGAIADYGIRTGGSEKIGRVARQIAIPTAAGTGAEVGRACVMTLAGGGKSVAVNLNMVADTVICDPDLTISLPPRLTAATGIDALSHGIETFLSPVVNPPAAAIARDCVTRAAGALRTAVADGNDRTARWEMMMAALEGGMVLQKGLGGAHALADSLGEGGRHHGTLIGVLLPHILRFNALFAGQAMADLGDLVGAGAGGALADWVERLVGDIGLPGRLRELGIVEADLDGVGEKAAAHHLNLTNPRQAGADEYDAMLRAAF